MSATKIKGGSSWPRVVAAHVNTISTYAGEFGEGARDRAVAALQNFLHVTDEQSYEADVAYQLDRADKGLLSREAVAYPWPKVSADRVKMRIVQPKGAEANVTLFVGLDS